MSVAVIGENKLKSSYALNLAESKNEATIDIFGVIGVWWDGVDSKGFVDEIKNLDVDNITINISSPGGFVDDALMIYDAIKGHRAFVTVQLSGVVGSAATFIACAADKVVGSDTLLYMIHNVSMGGQGTKHELRKAADLVEKIEDTIINLYRKKTGKSKSVIQKWLDAETWFTLDEAIENGFVDEKGIGMSFDYEAEISNNDLRNYMSNTMNCAKLPALPEEKENEISHNSQTDNNIMDNLNTEQKGAFVRFVNSLTGKKNDEAENKAEAPKAETNELETLKNELSELRTQLKEAQNAQSFDVKNFAIPSLMLSTVRWQK